MARIYLGLGTNIGDRAENLRQAIVSLAPEVAVQKVSSVYESEPMYETNQPRFYNIALLGTTNLSPQDLFTHVKSIEAKLGRKESSRNAPREMDIDILFYDDLILEMPELTIPHPRLHERAFVLVPLEEIDRFFMHPKLHTPVIDLWDAIGNDTQRMWLAGETL